MAVPLRTLRRALKLSGLSQSQFAYLHTRRSARTIKRWLAGGTIPASAARQLEQVVRVLEKRQGGPRD